MHFNLSSISALLAFTGLVTATPLLRERQDSGSSDSTTTPPDRYYLKTVVVGNLKDSGTNKDALYVYSSHTGAGLGDAGLGPDISVAWEGYLNGTQQLFTYPNAPAPWPLRVVNAPYQQWYLTTISISSQPQAGEPGFFFNSSGLQYNYTGSAGWLACDWWHGKPQLFNLGTYAYGAISSACSKVELQPVAVPSSS